MPIVAASHSAAKNLGLDQVNVAFLKDDYGQKQPLPLVITPRWDDSLGFLKAFCEQNRSWLDDQMLLYGAVLFRGFAIEDCSQLEQAIKAYQPNLHNTYRGT